MQTGEAGQVTNPGGHGHGRVFSFIFSLIVGGLGAYFLYLFSNRAAEKTTNRVIYNFLLELVRRV